MQKKLIESYLRILFDIKMLQKMCIRDRSMIVILRSRSEGSVRVAMIAGTLHPKPISMGTKLRPERPIFRSGLSMTNATRAIYPVSSRMDRKKNSTTIVGRKLSTLPTPAKIPSMISE